jgi:OmpA-OmpF porin, OOP family
MRKFTLAIAGLFIAGFAFSQDLPENPEPGKCYVRCLTPEIYEDVKETIVVKPAFTKLVVHPAEYKTISEKVLVKEASEKWVAHQAEWGENEMTYVLKEGAHTLKTTEATFKDNIKNIEIKPASASWSMGERMPDCESADPNDCRIWCYKEIPAINDKYPIEELNADASTTSTAVPEKKDNYSKMVVTKEPYIEKVVIPAEYATITKTVLVKDAWTEEIVVPEVTLDVDKEILVKKGGLTVWKEVDCELTEYSLLPINWRLNSYALTQSAKDIIDEKLIPILKENKGVTVEIASHTDSRGAKTDNQLLAERRAQAVVNYIISKGINASRLVPVGYGETRLINRCADGVACTEREHLQNRRTEFRIISR